MGQTTTGPTLVAINWRPAAGGMATFAYKGGATTSQPMSQPDARIAAEQAFGHGLGFVETDEGCRWTPNPPGRGLGLKSALPFGRARRAAL